MTKFGDLKVGERFWWGRELCIKLETVQSAELGSSWNAVRIEGQGAGDKHNCHHSAEVYREHEGVSGDGVAEKEVAQAGLEYLDDVVTRLEQANTAEKLAREVLGENQKEAMRAVHVLGVTWLDTYEKIKKYVHVSSEEDVAVSQFRSFLNTIVRRLK